MTGIFTENNFGTVNASQGIAPGVEDGPWQPFAGDPTPLVANGPLVLEANALCETWRTRVAYLATAQRGPEDARAAVVAFQEEHLAEIERAAQAGEISELAPILRDKRDRAERDALGTAWDDAINAASRLVDQALEAYRAHMENHWPALLTEIYAEAVKLPDAHAKICEEQRAKLDPIEQRWHELCEQSRKVIGYIYPFSPADLPNGDFTKPPFPSAESLVRTGVSVPAAVKTPHAPEAVEPEHTKPAAA
jgi:hypothetical protein